MLPVAGVAAVVVVGASVGVVVVVGQDRPGDADQRVRDGDGGFLLIAAAEPVRQAPEPGAGAGGGAADGPGRFGYGRARVPVAWRAAAFFRLPADSLSPGARPAQAASRAEVPNRVMSPPVSATMTCAVRCPMPGIVISRAV